jgi:cyclopropane-fatty-acyl-phospholipid synthase
MFAKYASDKFLKTLDQIQAGSVSVTMPDGKTYDFQGANDGAHATITMHDWRVISNLAAKGDVGFAEDYRDGLWETNNLENIIALGIQNKGSLDDYVLGSRMGRVREALSYFLKLNTKRGSKKNIHAHYDLGNAFYQLWLDPTMTYSSALFGENKRDLVQGQHNKYDRIVDLLDRQSGSVLEIGCGWGGFAERSLDRGDFDIRGVTLSEEQYDYAGQRLDGRQANIVLEDYRDQKGKFDNIVSIEMFEAVGEMYWSTYFDKVKSLLSEKGKAVIQTITMHEDEFDQYRKGSDFVRSFIFPGGMLPSVSKFKEKAALSGLKAGDEFLFGKDYAQTLRLWLQTFDAKIDEIKAQGFDERFIRLWRFYLAGCAAGFETGRTNVMQVELVHA